MAFWSDTSLDPKRQFKFSVTFGRLGGNATFLAQSADRPQFRVSDGTKVDFLDKSFHFPGKVTWEPVKVKFVDANGAGNVSRDSYEYLKSAGWINPAALGGAASTAGSGTNFATVSKQAGNNALKAGGSELIVKVLDSNGNAVDSWTLKNAFVSSVALNNLDYAAEGILTAEYTFRYDWAELK